MPILIDELSLFFPCHNEEENLLPLVSEALASLPALASRYEVIMALLWSPRALSLHTPGLSALCATK